MTATEAPAGRQPTEDEVWARVAPTLALGIERARAAKAEKADSTDKAVAS